MSKRRPKLIEIVVVLAVVGVVVVGVLSLTGPAVGNIFSNVVGALDGETAGSAGYVTREQYGQGSADLVMNPPASGVADLDSTANGQQPSDERVILKSAALNLTVGDPARRLTDIALMVEEMGGWVVTSSTSYFTNSAGEQAARGSITIRVPANRLNEALERIKSGDGLVKINGESISGQDVTQQYVDLSSRLRNLEAAETQLQTIMDSARRVDDVMTVYNQLVSVRSEIETIKGQLQYFDEAASYSSIQIDLLPPEPGPVQTQASGWSPVKAAENALGALVSVARTGVDLAVTLIVFLGPLALGGWVLWTLFRLSRRFARRQEA